MVLLDFLLLPWSYGLHCPFLKHCAFFSLSYFVFGKNWKIKQWEELRAIFNETDRHEESHEDGFEKENGHHFEDILDEHSLKPDLPGRVQIDPQGRDSNARNESTKPAESVFSISKSTRSKSMKHTSRRSKSIRGRKSDGYCSDLLSTTVYLFFSFISFLHV